ncbi:hypothetical protein GCM10023116_17880 [Kistimonas scapharcae]|uniref:Uncharacterized protein n=1 Tax=Kistimonas scapharcae TaxID=1036133 RepID=A0ABP8V273_9GAMM
MSNPAVQDKLRLAGITALALLAASTAIFLVFLGLGALLLDTLLMAMIFSVCCSIPALVMAAIYIPIGLRERFPCRPDSAEPSAPPREPDPPFVLANLTAAYEAARTCTDEDFVRFTALIIELYTLQQYNTFEPYQEAARWLQNRLTQTPDFAGRLQEYGVNQDRDYLLSLNSTLSTDKIEKLLHTIGNDQAHLTVREKAQLNTYLENQLIRKMTHLGRKLNHQFDETSVTEESGPALDSRLDHIFQLCQCIDLCDAVGNNSQRLRDARNQGAQCYQRHCAPIRLLCQQNGIDWAKAPLAQAINQKLPLHCPAFQPEGLAGLERCAVPAINLVDGDLVDYEQRPAYLQSHQRSPDSWVSRITHQPFVCKDIARLDQLLPLAPFRVNRLLNRTYS